MAFWRIDICRSLGSANSENSVDANASLAIRPPCEGYFDPLLDEPLPEEEDEPLPEELLVPGVFSPLKVPSRGRGKLFIKARLMVV